MKKIKRLLSLIVCTTIVSTCAFVGTSLMGNALEVNAAEFARGADVGWLPQMEETGFVFRNDDGDEEDCLEILKDHGIDSIRLRTWVDPSDDRLEGHCSADETVEMAVRAQEMGFKIMIDFHYSDSWADPGKQRIPNAWKNDTLEEMKVHLYDYTYEVMTKLKDAGVTPEWVQVGNEINPGMLLPLGSITTPENLVQLINEGYDAVKAVSPDTKVIIHRAEGADNRESRKFFDKLKDNNAKYDVIGLSYYPSDDYTYTIDELGDNLNDMVSRYDKEVMVVEVGADCVWDELTAHNMLVAVQNKVEEVQDGKGLGVFYWEPQGAKSWSGYSLSAWHGYDGTEKDGMPTKALDAFIPGQEEINENPVTAIELDKSEAEVEIGNTVTLNAALTPSNATYKGVTFTSSDESIAKVSKAGGIVTGIAPGTVTITATSYDNNLTATCEVTVVESSNLISNPGFELDGENWTITGDSSAVTFENDTYSGHKALHYYNGDFEVSQTITNLENGTYKLSAWTSGGGDEKLTEIFAINGQGERMTEPFVNVGWAIWNQYVINDIEVTDGTLTIGAKVEMNENGGQWGNIDEFELVKIGGNNSSSSSSSSKGHKHTAGNSEDENVNTDVDNTNKEESNIVIDTEEKPVDKEDKVTVEGWKLLNDSWYVMKSNGDFVRGWYNDSIGWSYLSLTDGRMLTGWVQDKGNWYFINNNGYMATGWILDNGNWYYLKDDGVMATGWIYDRGNWYYCYGEGLMAADTVIDGYAVDSNGAWIQ